MSQRGKRCRDSAGVQDEVSTTTTTTTAESGPQEPELNHHQQQKQQPSLLPQSLLPMDLIEHTNSFMPQPALYLVSSKLQIAKYDVACTGKYEIHTDLSRAIERARKIFFDHVNNAWRDGIMDSCQVRESSPSDDAESRDDGKEGKITGVKFKNSTKKKRKRLGGPEVPCEFTLDNVEKWDSWTLAEIWATSDDCRTDTYGGVARVNVYKMYPFSPSSGAGGGRAADESTKTGLADVEFHHSAKSIVYTLPVPHRYDDGDEDDENDYEEESSEEEGQEAEESATDEDEKDKEDGPEAKEVYGLENIRKKEQALDALHKKNPVKPDERNAARNVAFI